MQPIIEDREIVSHSINVQINFDVRPHKNHVLKAIECFPNSPVYEEVSDLFDILYEEALKVINPRAVWRVEPNDGSGRIPELKHCDEWIYTTVTLGEEIVKVVNQYFVAGDMMEGMLLDAIATGILFQVGSELYKSIYNYVANQHKGMMALSPGERGAPIQYQTIIEEKLGEVNGIRVTDGYLLEPIKSTSSIYGVGSGMELSKVAHNCRKCPDDACKWRLAPYEG